MERNQLKFPQIFPTILSLGKLRMVYMSLIIIPVTFPKPHTVQKTKTSNIFKKKEKKVETNKEMDLLLVNKIFQIT